MTAAVISEEFEWLTEGKGCNEVEGKRKRTCEEAGTCYRKQDRCVETGGKIWENRSVCVDKSHRD